MLRHQHHKQATTTTINMLDPLARTATLCGHFLATIGAVCLIASSTFSLITFSSSLPLDVSAGQPQSSWAPSPVLQLNTYSAPTSGASLNFDGTHRAAIVQQTDEQQLQQLRLKRQSSNKKNKNKPNKNKKLLAECLAVHNKYRRQHGVPDLQWDDKIAEFAQKRSNHIAASDGAEFGHPPDLPFGENLFWHSSVETACEHMVKGWYDEIDLYDFKAPTFAPATGHFTQLIWRTTTRVGCAFATSSGKRGGIYLTCNYDPPGNFLGEFIENVPRPLSNSFAKPLPPPPISSMARTVTTSTSTTQRPTTALASSTTSTTTGKPETAKPKKKGKGKKKNKNQKDKKRNKKKGKGKKKNKNKKTTSTTQAPQVASSSATTTSTTKAPKAVTRR